MISSFDTKIIVDELNNEYEIPGMKVDKVYKIGDEIRIKLYGRGRRDLILKPGEAVYVTQYPKQAPQRPSGFAMQLRKYLSGLRIMKISQLGFDRIVKLSFGLFGEKEDLIKFHVIVELFGNGNLILADDDLSIIGVLQSKVWSTRSLKAREIYEPPPQMLSPFDVDAEDILDGTSEIVKLLATKLNMGGMYAEEVCLRAGIDKHDPNPDPNLVKKGLEVLVGLAPSPAIVGGSIVPFDLLVHKGRERKPFSTLNNAADEIYGKHEMEQIAKKEVSKQQKHLSKLERILASQEKTVSQYEKKGQLAHHKGELIFSNYQLVDTLLSTLHDAVKGIGWDAVKERLANADNAAARTVRSLDPKNGTITVVLDSDEVVLDIRKNINDNAQSYYETSKKMRHKIEGATKAMEMTRAKMERALKDDVEVKEVKKKVRKKKEWYERYRWFYTSDGHLVVGGRDARTNETIVKRYLKESDLHVHADITGAPQVIIKDAGDATDETIKEAGIFAVSFSKAWKISISSLDAYWVHPEQVTKDAPSGEFLGKGAFFIKGKKNYLHKLPVEVAIGIYKGKIMCGPLEAISKNCERHVQIVPGQMSKEQTGKRLMKIFEWDDVNDIVQALPSGTCNIVMQ